MSINAPFHWHISDVLRQLNAMPEWPDLFDFYVTYRDMMVQKNHPQFTQGDKLYSLSRIKGFSIRHWEDKPNMKHIWQFKKNEA